VDVAGFHERMEEQRAKARAAQKKQTIELSQVEAQEPTRFVGYDQLETEAKVLEVIAVQDKTAVVLDTSACYAEMGGQVVSTDFFPQDATDLFPILTKIKNMDSDTLSLEPWIRTVRWWQSRPENWA
jgi:alanyl-tRNA synthetase